ncbi:uncharacterized, partial [Tachysurus ichikawai]
VLSVSRALFHRISCVSRSLYLRRCSQNHQSDQRIFCPFIPPIFYKNNQISISISISSSSSSSKSDNLPIPRRSRTQVGDTDSTYSYRAKQLLLDHSTLPHYLMCHNSRMTAISVQLLIHKACRSDLVSSSVIFCLYGLRKCRRS